jgi:transposase
VVSVEQWAEIGRLYFVKRLSIKEIVRRTGHGRNTIRRALRSGEPPRYRRPPRPSKLDPFRDEAHRLLRAEPRLSGKRVRELRGAPAEPEVEVRPLARYDALIPA